VVDDANARILAQAAGYARLINGEIARAIALQQLWESGAIVPAANELLAAVRAAKLIGFDLVRETIHRDLVFTLVKLFDPGENDLSFPRVLATPGLQGNAPNPSAWAELQVCVDNCSNSDALRSLKMLRNKILAHTDTRDVLQSAVYGHSSVILDDAIYCSERLSAAVQTLPPYADPTTMVWRVEAKRFWKAVASGAPLVQAVRDL